MSQLLYCFFLTALISITSLGQNVSNNIQVDNLGNVYIIQSDRILKFDSEGEQKASFSYKSSGAISSVDVSDPLRILVFYKDFGQLIFLDNTLSITNGPVSLFKKDIINPVLVCNSSDKGLWIYDLQGFTLLKLDANLQIVLRITDLPTLIESEFEPVFMMNANALLYITDPGQGLFIFDQYGSLFKKLHFKNIKSFNIYENALFYEDSGFVKRISLLDYSELTMNLNKEKYLGLAFKEKFIYLLNNDGVSYTKMELLLSKE